jgi:hypothetical protein
MRDHNDNDGNDEIPVLNEKAAIDIATQITQFAREANHDKRDALGSVLREFGIQTDLGKSQAGPTDGSVPAPVEILDAG